MRTLISLLLVWTMCTPAPGQDDQPMIGQAAPDFTLTGTDGIKYRLADLRDKYVVIHFATTWCPFCNAEAPYLEQLNKDYRNQNVQVFIIDVKEDKELVEKVFNRFQFTFPVLLDPEGQISASYAPDGVLPALARDEVPLASNLIIDRDGRIQFYSLLNSRDFDAKLVQLRTRLDQLLAAKQ
jgi:peroxiredoxin